MREEYTVGLLIIMVWSGCPTGEQGAPLDGG